MDIMAAIHSCATRICNSKEYQDAAGFTGPVTPVYSYDNVNKHRTAEVAAFLRQLGIDPNSIQSRVPHPSWSPDFNRPVEHAHNIIKSNFKQYLYKWPDWSLPGLRPGIIVRGDARLASQRCQHLVTAIFWAFITKEGVYKDVMSLPKMWQEILRLGGDWCKYSS